MFVRDNGEPGLDDLDRLSKNGVIFYATQGDPDKALGGDVGAESDSCACGVALEGRLGQAYNEEAFRYFLAIERKRSQRSGRPLLLLLVDLKQQPDDSVCFDPMVAAKLFSALWLCLRESDFVGWYREGRVAGAVLTQLAGGPGTAVSRLIRQRVSGVLREGLRASVGHRLQVHVYQLKPTLTS